MVFKYIPLIFLLLSTFFLGCSFKAEQLNLIEKTAPNSIYYPLDGDQAALSAHKGKIIVLVFWDADCIHCHRELPKLNLFAKSFIGNDNIFFLAISVNRANEEESVKFTIEDLNLDALTHAFSGNDTLDQSFQSFKGDTIPYFVVIDKSWQVHSIHSDAGQVRNQVIELFRNNKQ